MTTNQTEHDNFRITTSRSQSLYVQVRRLCDHWCFWVTLWWNVLVYIIKAPHYSDNLPKTTAAEWFTSIIEDDTIILAPKRHHKDTSKMCPSWGVRFPATIRTLRFSLQLGQIISNHDLMCEKDDTEEIGSSLKHWFPIHLSKFFSCIQLLIRFVLIFPFQMFH